MKKRSTQFNCFSPPVMIATMIVETCMAIYTVWRYKMTPLVRLATVTLLALAGFQLAEYFVCTGAVGNGLTWSRIGFAAITLLPPLGLHLMHQIAGKPGRRLVTTAYVTMGAFVVFFLAFPSVFDNYQCTGNYVVFRLRPGSGGVYWIYYMGWIFTAMAYGVHWANELKRRGKLRQMQATQGMLIGWLVFLVPTAIANIISPSTRAGIPSVMCGFAVLFALILVLYILPRVAHTQRELSIQELHKS